ncbi:MAG: ABC transporter permease [Polyangiaceae bacterium]
MSALSVVEQTMRISVPYLFAAAGGVLAERSGVVALKLEGLLLSGAFCAVLGTSLSGSPWVGILAGVFGGLLFGGLYALAALRFRADQIVVGIAVNLLALGATRLFLKLVVKSSSNSGRIPGFGDTGGDLATFQSPLFWMGLAAIPAVAFLIDRTAFGLRVRAVGEHPQAAETVGVRVARVRLVAVAISSALVGLGGAYLSLDQHQFSDNMSAGRGFIALAALITGSWRPLRTGVACVVFAAAETLQIQLQSWQAIPSQLLSAFPYALTIAVLVVWVGRSRAPAALGKVD